LVLEGATVVAAIGAAVASVGAIVATIRLPAGRTAAAAVAEVEIAAVGAVWVGTPAHQERVVVPTGWTRGRTPWGQRQWIACSWFPAEFP
jgi:hypothetical protein